MAQAVKSMKKRRVTGSAGRPRDLAEYGKGYASSGESEYSRIAARGNFPLVKMLNRVNRTRGEVGRPLDQIIAETAGEIRWMEAQIRVEDSRARADKMKENLEIKTRFLERLRREKNLGAAS